MAQADKEPMGEKYDKYAAKLDPWLGSLAFVFLVCWSSTIIFHGRIPWSMAALLNTVLVGIWVLFLVDIIIRTVISKRSWRYLWTHPIDVIAVLVPALRPLKILTAFQGLAFNTSSGRVRTFQAVGASMILLLWIGSVWVLSAERGHPDAQITNLGDALWWSIVTVTTVGYGDFAPVSVQGRFIAIVMMLLGIALIGIVTASVAAWFVKLTSGEEIREDEEREVERHAELMDRIAVLERKINSLQDRGKTH